MGHEDFERAFDYENGFWRTAAVDRVGKFLAHADFFRMSSSISGEIVECGIFKGASLYRFVKLRSLLENQKSRQIIGFDIFGKFPEAGTAEDIEKRAQFTEVAGEEGPEMAMVLEPLETLGLEGNVELVQGDVCKTIPAYCEKWPQLRISLLNIDVDLYEPTRACLENLYPRVTRGGVVIFDDYGAFPGASRAIDEYFEGQEGVKIQKLPYAFSMSYLIKP